MTQGGGEGEERDMNEEYDSPFCGKKGFKEGEEVTMLYLPRTYSNTSCFSPLLISFLFLV